MTKFATRLGGSGALLVLMGAAFLLGRRSAPTGPGNVVVQERPAPGSAGRRGTGAATRPRGTVGSPPELVEGAAEPKEGQDAATLEWEAVPEAERPTPWADTVSEVVERCAPDVSVVNTDCDTYPCVAVLRTTGVVSSADALSARLSACEDYPRLSTPMPAVLAVDADVPCGDGSFSTMIVLTAVNEETAAAQGLFGSDDRPFQSIMTAGVNIGRRVQSAVESLPCDVK